jgi:chromosome segregation protein
MFWIREFELVHWAYWQREALTFERTLIGLFGPNGSGKTSFLDAIRTAFGIECAGERDYKHYVRPHKAPYAWLRAVLRNDPHNGQRPFRVSNPFVTVICRMRLSSNEWHREYLVAPGDQSIEWAEKMPKSEWLVAKHYKEQLELAGLTREIANVMRIPQDETSRLAFMKPNKLLNLILEVRGDKRPIEDWRAAREHQAETMRHLKSLEANREYAEAHVAHLKASAASYQKYLRLTSERQDIVAIRLPQAKYRERFSSWQKTGNFVRNDIADLSKLREELVQEASSVAVLAKARDRYQKQADEAVDASTGAAQEAGTKRQELKACDEALTERDRLRLQVRRDAGEKDPVAAHAAILQELSPARTKRGEKIAQANAVAEELASMPKGKPASPADVQRFRAALDERGIQYRMLAEVVEVADERWSEAMEGVLAQYRHIILLSRERDEGAAMELGEKGQYRHYVVPRLADAISPKFGSLLEKANITGRVPAWLLSELNAIRCVESIQEGLSLPRDIDWITPKAYHRNRRGGRSRAVADGHFSAGAREKAHQGLIARSAALSRDVADLDKKIAGLETEGNRLLKLIAGLDAAKRLEAQAERFATAEKKLPELRAACAEAEKALEAAKADSTEALGELQKAIKDYATTEARVGELNRKIAEKRKDFVSKRRSQRDDIREMRTMRNGPLADLFTPQRLATATANDTVQGLEDRLRSLDEEFATDLEKDPTVLDRLTLAQADLESKTKLIVEKNTELDRTVRATIKARDEYLNVVRRTVSEYESAVKTLAGPAGIEVRFVKPQFGPADDPTANTGLTVTASFHGKEANADEGLAGLSGGQRVVFSMILLLALLGKDRPKSMFFIDEPFAHLDSINVELVASFLDKTPGQFLITIPERENADVFQRLGVAYFTRLRNPKEPWAPRIGLAERTTERRAA